MGGFGTPSNQLFAQVRCAYQQHKAADPPGQNVIITNAILYFLGSEMHCGWVVGYTCYRAISIVDPPVCNT